MHGSMRGIEPLVINDGGDVDAWLHEELFDRRASHPGIKLTAQLKQAVPKALSIHASGRHTPIICVLCILCGGLLTPGGCLTIGAAVENQTMHMLERSP